MSVDKFGRHESSVAREVLRGPPGQGFHLNPDGNYDLKSKRVVNLGDAIGDAEAVNLKTLHNLSLTFDGSVYDAKNKRIVNVGLSQSDSDVVNRKYVLTEINKLKKEFNLKISSMLSGVTVRTKQPEVVITSQQNHDPEVILMKN